ncbi:hypothetical protein [Streptosporangium lutulentum]|uniref:Uncharacterized protein n=1 Tax=Streptosporangium lutulentum TaxID=1461250 RepID=A0ABT9QAR8_9ACTN|nr:hypothetical protein [Streptosporangium lutulentum]MDP9843363.1 hypothetical protein [Streptosporangium lutulentum]
MSISRFDALWNAKTPSPTLDGEVLDPPPAAAAIEQQRGTIGTGPVGRSASVI